MHEIFPIEQTLGGSFRPAPAQHLTDKKMSTHHSTVSYNNSCHFVFQIHFKMTLHSHSPDVRAAFCCLKSSDNNKLAVSLALEWTGLPNYLKHVLSIGPVSYIQMYLHGAVWGLENSLAEPVITVRWGFKPVIMFLGWVLSPLCSESVIIYSSICWVQPLEVKQI